MRDLLKLIRWKNLLIVVFTMVLMRYAVIEPLLEKVNVTMNDGSAGTVPMELQFPWFNFALLIAATVFITAAGYVINDYFDIKTDLINRGKVIVGTKIPRRKAMALHTILNIAGVIAGFYISWRSGYFWMGTLFLIVSGLLYFYSASYKRQFLIGNLIVAILAAMVPMLVVFYEWPALYKYYMIRVVDFPGFSFLFYWIGGFALFAFLITLTREIIKDIEDFEGDKAYGRNTIPVVLGIKASKILSIVLILITVLLLYLVWNSFIHDTVTLIYISLAIVFPLLIVIYQVIKSQDNKIMHRASSLLKVVILTGISYSLIVKAIITWNLY